MEQLKARLKELEDQKKEIDKTLYPINVEIKSIKSQIAQKKEDDQFSGFDEVMRKYYTHKLPNRKGSDLTELYNYWDNSNDENNMRELFEYVEMDRYRNYDIAEMLWEWECAVQWLSDRGVSEKTINGLRQWYNSPKDRYFDKEDYEKYVIKTFDEIPEDEQDEVKEYMRLFYNISVSECICDW